MRVFLITMFLVFSCCAEALTFKWAHATVRENGSAVELAEIASYELRALNASNEVVWQKTVAGDKTEYVAADEEFSAVTRLEIAVTDSNGLLGKWRKIENKYIASPTAGEVF